MLTLAARESWLSFRDRLLASAKFQDFAAKFPLTRWVARREARALFDICAGFVYAQTLAACVKLDLFEILAAGPMAPAVLAARSDVPAAAMLMLLDAAVSLRLLGVSGPKYRLGPLGAALRGNPGIAAMVAHHRLFYADIADPVALLRGETETQLAKFWPYRGESGDAAGYSALMAATQPMIAREILQKYDFSKHSCLLDVGGGNGAFLRAVAGKARHLRLILFDLPGVDAPPGPYAAVSGDVFTDKLPGGADVITLVRVLHDHDDGRALAILRAARAALPPGGVLLIAEPLAGAAGAEPIGAAYFGFYLLAMGSGRARKFADIAALLRAAGFGAVTRIPTNQPMLTGLLKASVSFS